MKIRSKASLILMLVTCFQSAYAAESYQKIEFGRSSGEGSFSGVLYEIMGNSPHSLSGPVDISTGQIGLKQIDAEDGSLSCSVFKVKTAAEFEYQCSVSITENALESGFRKAAMTSKFSVSRMSLGWLLHEMLQRYKTGMLIDQFDETTVLKPEVQKAIFESWDHGWISFGLDAQDLGSTSGESLFCKFDNLSEVSTGISCSFTAAKS